MNKFFWNETKSSRLKQVRGVDFKEIITGEILDVINNPSRNNQKMLVVKYRDYCWAVPFVATEEGAFLKTIYPSRKLKKIYLES